MAGDMKVRRPIPHYTNDRALLMARARRGEHMHDDPVGLERLQGADFISPNGEVTVKGQEAIEEIRRLAVVRGVPSPRFPVDA